MKKFLLAVMGLMLATQLIACQNNDNDNGSSGGTTATTPLDQGCLYGSTNCNSAIYN